MKGKLLLVFAATLAPALYLSFDRPATAQMPSDFRGAPGDKPSESPASVNADDTQEPEKQLQKYSCSVSGPCTIIANRDTRSFAMENCERLRGGKIFFYRGLPRDMGYMSFMCMGSRRYKGSALGGDAWDFKASYGALTVNAYIPLDGSPGTIILGPQGTENKNAVSMELRCEEVPVKPGPHPCEP